MVGRKGGDSNTGSFPTSIHRLLGMDSAQVRAELAAQGKTPDDIAQKCADIGRKVAEAFPDVGSAEFSFELASRDGLEFAPADPDALGAARSVCVAAQASAPAISAWGQDKWARAKMVPCADMGFPLDASERPFDLVVFDPESTPKDGDVVLAWLESTRRGLRRLRQVGPDEIRLEPLGGEPDGREAEHPSNFLIHGVALALARRAS